ncbi:MAG: 5-formyltetrahydrofolate cyclo-ligase [Porphyromonas sp.]|nr:5-formyltetrahydrofolate cyclo-ligase [Porphyromonas sp.]
MTKKEIRQQIKQKIKSLTPLQQSQEAVQAATVLADFLEKNFPKASIALFFSMSGEIETGDLIPTLTTKGFKVSLPRVEGENIHFYPVGKPGGDFFDISEYGIREPLGTETDRVCSQIDVVIVPGLAFDHKGARLGRGKGFYDRFLNAHPDKVKIGYAFDCQILPEIPTEEHDIKMDYVISASGLKTFDNRR